MKSGELHKASIIIAGKDFPLKLNASEIKELRSIETDINNTIIQYQKQFGNMSLQDCITLALIAKSFENKELSNAGTETTKQALSKLESVLEE